jgi:hypothetical protein
VIEVPDELVSADGDAAVVIASDGGPRDGECGVLAIFYPVVIIHVAELSPGMSSDTDSIKRILDMLLKPYGFDVPDGLARASCPEDVDATVLASRICSS